MVLLVLLLVAIATTQTVVVGNDIPPCIKEMYTCQDHAVFGGMEQRPSPECCATFAAVVENQLPCVCSVLMNSRSQFSASVDVAQARTLPASCNLNLAPKICSSSDDQVEEPLPSTYRLSSLIENAQFSEYPPVPERGGRSLSIGQIIGIATAIFVSFFIGIAFIIRLLRYRQRIIEAYAPSEVTVQPLRTPGEGSTEGSSHVSTVSRGGIDPLMSMISFFSLEDLVMATKDFAEENLLGKGGFGDVHKGVLPNGREVAIKNLRLGSTQGEREFKAEVETISRVHHRHLVSLVGYCIQEDRRLLVYEFVSNGTLAFHLHATGRPPLEWNNRMKVALGSAKGLSYLHEDCNPKIIHRDIKAPNILIGSNFDAKVADFGLAKLVADFETHVSTRIMGTIGYLAPEYALTGRLSEKSDVFSYGVVLLELITGQRPVVTVQGRAENLVTWVSPHLTRAVESNNYDEIADPRLEHNYDHDQMSRLVECAAACTRRSARKRPKMSQVVRVIEGGVSMDELHQGLLPEQDTTYSSSSAWSSESGDHNNLRRERVHGVRQWSEGSGSSDDYTPSDYSLAHSGEGRRS